MANYKKSKVQSKGSLKPLVLITLVIVVVFVTLFMISQKNKKENQQPVSFQEQLSLVNQPVMGKDDAPVTLIEFGDYKCPSCKAWGEQVYPQLKKDYIDTGKVKFAYINVLFHGTESMLGALAGESVFTQNPKAFWPFHKALFDAQPKENHDGLWITEAKVIEIAKASAPQIDLVKLKEDLTNQTALPQVKTDNDLVGKYGIQQTPTIMINGEILKDPFDVNKMKSVLEKYLGVTK
ncbi:DsbA family protein [Paenibacillus alginolyticus]|uniref:DsbA family protein n=1 Tax=Paenibacillus alginolyticus TaxID=59839 RepID=A0ABT4GIY4_9BACL|nr:DsbA family protein [Paenibacillus alginolyticus]MCY9696146.1 DsbA family protein [Paenibacillus alginolyticus]MEC0143299.1 DsbA family protein [Paenibacillus alginolyticus]